MENENEYKKCSSQKHKDLNANYYCQECHLYMCKKCENLHSELFQNHNIYNLDKSIDEIFTGFCSEENHLEKLNFYCKDHNKLCCASCLCKIEGKNYGTHSKCNVCIIEEIKKDKKKMLDEKLLILEDFSKRLNESIKLIKIIYDKIDENKEELKSKIQNIFTKIRNELNEKEDRLLLELDNSYNEIYLKEDLPQKCEKIFKKLNISLEKGRKIESQFEDGLKLNLTIYNCIQFEKKINLFSVNEAINKCNILKDFQFKFIQEKNNDINSIINSIKNFGNFNKINFNFIESNIIDNNNYITYLIKWINPNKEIKAKLLYSLSREWDKISKFHELCDNKGNTLTLFHIKDDNNKVGIYTNLPWDCNSGWKKGSGTFLFNLNKNTKYKIRGNKESIGCLDNYGPYAKCFGCEKSMNQIILYYKSINSYFENGNEILQYQNQNNNDFNYYNNPYYNNPVPNKNETYDLKEVEVFEISFDK